MHIHISAALGFLLSIIVITNVAASPIIESVAGARIHLNGRSHRHLNRTARLGKRGDGYPLQRRACRHRQDNILAITATSTSASSQPTPSPSNNSPVLVVANGGDCGSPNATPEPFQSGGPNGDESWLNCGLDRDSGWVPPPITLDNLVHKELSEVLQNPSNPFSGCEPYLGLFEDAARATGIPSIIIASIAVQESSCRPEVTGSRGEVGMMQITPDKCGDVANCYDAGTNIGIGARYLKQVLSDSGGNIAVALGAYNGWQPNLKAGMNNCVAGQNFDYLQQVLNGYLQGVAPSSMHMNTVASAWNC